MRLTSEECRSRLERARSARLATASAAGAPHLVPITFVCERDRLYFAIDHKPKSASELRRLANIRENPQVSVLVDHYDEDWTQLWWVRVDGHAEIGEHGPERERALDLLAAKYRAYRETRPEGALVTIAIEHITGWQYQD
ncbi:TIGR03668 family PPOX class F420-dependent oxidoreductase [Streptacidiphilus fuscans]|uniref:TIGR03668 family PPOX class F420-dependent oxidoreductase n=1 Tax=Streptacidiphilus fuscans TaxID=2789292 RepID=A0A931B4T4_9ACTN|nr:TIGR03668 family PPOX class F420-dependent oxidoreductase [Streptacidiphilus fuscans]MBF9069397.1 TIGR03668 family PPOX class F420-dependent oxidoreductase [Streptacidiphilus fuscans]